MLPKLLTSSHAISFYNYWISLHLNANMIVYDGE